MEEDLECVIMVKKTTSKSKKSIKPIVKVKSFIPCKLVYPYIEHFGIEMNHTCVEVFDRLLFFDFPSLPRDLSTLVLLETDEKVLKIGMNIVDEGDNKIVKEKIHTQEIPKDITKIEFNQNFGGIVFPHEGRYFFQLIINKKIVHRHDFSVIKIQRGEYSTETLEKLLDDPETVKSTWIVLKCKCGHKKSFYQYLDPNKEEEDKKEAFPEEDTIRCENCGQEINIKEAKANARFLLGSRMLRDTFNRNLRESKALATCGFLNTALVMQVTAFEAFMRDMFEANYKNWFYYLLMNDSSKVAVENVKRKMLSILKELGMKDQFYDRLFLIQSDSELSTLKGLNKQISELFFGDDEERKRFNLISFQQLTGAYGCFWAYKNFFDMDIKKELDKQKKKFTEKLKKNFQLRHKIIHGSSELTFVKEITGDTLKENEEIILFVRKYIKDKLKKIDEFRTQYEKENLDEEVADVKLKE